jgi:hypothetical protein
MSATLKERTSIFIQSREIFESDGYWWVTVEYSDGGQDEYGPFTEEQAQNFI